MTLSPVSASFKNRSMSRVRLNGSSKAMSFHCSTITFDDDPMPRTNRPGAADAIDATDWAMSPGPRVNAGTIAVPRRSSGACTDASASGVNASAPLASDDHASV